MFHTSTTHIDSWYAASAADRIVDRAPLRETLDVDVCIVGAGFFGLNCAIELARAGKRVVVLEASRVGWGASGRNGGQMILGYSSGMEPIEATLGHDRARRLWDHTRAAAADIRELIRRYAIDCEQRDGYLEVAVQQRRVPGMREGIEESARDWGYGKLQFIDRAALRSRVDSARYLAGVFDPEGGHLHPLKYVLGLARAAESEGVRIFEGSKVELYVDRGNDIELHVGPHRVLAAQIVLACNAYIDRLDPQRAAKVLGVGSFMAATEPLGEARARSLISGNEAVCDNQFILDYFRTSADHRLLWGGKCTYLGGTPANLAEVMRADMLRVFPQLADVAITHAWGGHIDITVKRTPDWGHRDRRVFWAQGFCGHGVVPTRAAARVVSAAVLGDTEELDWMLEFHNPDFPLGERFGALMQAAGMAYFRLRDIV
jgi:glycine/D-amino acid oxidase-like deaminating enzyme